MEGGVGALAVASGMAAITYAMPCIARAGDNIVSTSQPYGGTDNLFAHSLPNQGIDVRMVDARDIDAFAAQIDAGTRAIFRESIGNPAGNVDDLKSLADIAHRHGIPLIVDNTVATPYLCRSICGGRASGIPSFGIDGGIEHIDDILAEIEQALDKV